MLESGRMINRMVLEFRSGWMEKDMKDNIKMDQRVATDCSNF